MDAMKALSAICLSATICIFFAGCDGSPLLRERYLGQSITEPELIPQGVRRDAYGNPILKQEEEKSRSFWRLLLRD